jgi:hypothetical protein
VDLESHNKKRALAVTDPEIYVPPLGYSDPTDLMVINRSANRQARAIRDDGLGIDRLLDIAAPSHLAIAT